MTTRTIDYSRQKKQFAHSSSRRPQNHFSEYSFFPRMHPLAADPAGSVPTTLRTPVARSQRSVALAPTAVQSISATLIVCTRRGPHEGYCPSNALRSHSSLPSLLAALLPFRTSRSPRLVSA